MFDTVGHFHPSLRLEQSVNKAQLIYALVMIANMRLWRKWLIVTNQQAVIVMTVQSFVAQVPEFTKPFSLSFPYEKNKYTQRS